MQPEPARPAPTALPASDPLEPLCRECRDIFRGRYAPIGETAEQNPDALVRPEQLVGSTPDDSTWHIKVSELSGPSGSSGPSGLPMPTICHLHHTLLSLARSSTTCVLCALVWERTQVDPPILPDTARDLFGVPVIIRNGTEFKAPFSLAFVYVTQRQHGMLVTESWYKTQLSVIGLSVPRNKATWDFTWTREQTYSRIKDWLSTTADHPAQLGSGLPTRLIYLGSLRKPQDGDGTPKHVKLVETTCHHDPGLSLDPDTRYAALSHVWGGAQPLRLLKSSYEHFLDRIAWDSIPKTFRDAMELAAELGTDYIWIDSLCIIQDSQSDWQGEAASFASVYTRAHVTISATSADDPSTGLKHDSMLKHACIARPAWTGFDERGDDGNQHHRLDSLGAVRIIDSQSFSRHVLSRPLFKRGWVFQEYVLSPRTIHCARDQLWWSSIQHGSSATYARNETCAGFDFDPMTTILLSVSLRDIYGLGPATDNSYDSHGSHDSHDHPLTVWTSVLQDHMTRRFTYEADRLVAMAGIAAVYSALAGVPGSEYLAGHWRRTLRRELLWSVRDGKRVAPPLSYRAPSWSWASTEPVDADPKRSKFTIGWTGGVLESDAAGLDRMDVRDTVDVLDARVSTAVVGSASPSPFGPPTDGFIVLQSPLVKAALDVRVLEGTTIPARYHAEFFPNGVPRTAQPALTVRCCSRGASADADADADADTDADAPTTATQDISGIQLDDVLPPFAGQGPVDARIAVFRYQVDPGDQRTWAYGLILVKGCEKGQYRRVGFVNLFRDIVGMWAPTGDFGVFAPLEEDDFLARGERPGFYTYRVV